jgi:uncharacterized protein (TIGR02466 family)
MKERQVQLINLFPTLIYKTQIEHIFSKKENKYIEEIREKYLHKNIGNYSSASSKKGSYILSNQIFKKLKQKLLFYIEDYMYNVLTYQNIKPYITQSWLNYTKHNEHHHLHFHQNSFLSGVLYLKTSDKDTIHFKNRHINELIPEVKDQNVYNSDSWWVPVKEMDLVLFESKIPHFVSTKKDDNLRISLAFNVWLKGTLGSQNKLTELIL